MTRKRSRREIKRSVDGLDSKGDPPEYPEVVAYLKQLGDMGPEAPTPTERFGKHVAEGFPDMGLPFDESDLPPEIDPEDFTTMERFGLCLLGENIRRSILQYRLERGRAER